MQKLLTDIGEKSKKAINKRLSTKKKDKVLKDYRLLILKNKKLIINENKKDIKHAYKKGIKNNLIQRLILNDKKIIAITNSIKKIISLKDPTNVILEKWKRPNGLIISKVSIPIGVIGVIYESRPNVTADVASLCFKSGNAVILKGGSEAYYSNLILTKFFRKSLKKNNVDENFVQFLKLKKRSVVDFLLQKMSKFIDVIIPRGGKGGLGNTRFKSSTNRAPRKFTKGTRGEEFTVWLQLKTIADVGIIGLPNAGKSSLLAAITNANPKIANYEFTTLNPNLGVASYDDKEVTIADIPGLVEGAHKGTGLGIQFLKHIERCKSLLHMIDITNDDIKKSYNQVKKELKSYSSKLAKKRELIVLNKTDLIDDKEMKKIEKNLKKITKSEIITISTIKKKYISKIKAKLVGYAS